MANIKAIEHNNGSISVFCLENDVPIWGAHYHAAGDVKQAAADYKLLLDGADPVADNWGYGDFDDLDQVREDYQCIIDHWEDEFNGGFCVLADDDTFYPESHPGYAGSRFLQELDVAFD